MKRSLNLVSICFGIFLGVGCGPNSPVDDAMRKDKDSSERETGNLISPYRIVSEGGGKVMILDTIKFNIPRVDQDSITLDGLYDGIYVLNDTTLERNKAVSSNSYVLFSVSEDLGMGRRGYLYIFDRKAGAFIRDTSFGRKCLYNSGAIFLFDRARNRIFSVDKPAYYPAKDEVIVAGALYEITGANFHHLRSTYIERSDIPGGKALVGFYQNTVKEKYDSIHILPEGWWDPGGK